MVRNRQTQAACRIPDFDPEEVLDFPLGPDGELEGAVLLERGLAAAPFRLLVHDFDRVFGDHGSRRRRDLAADQRLGIRSHRLVDQLDRELGFGRGDRHRSGRRPLTAGENRRAAGHHSERVDTDIERDLEPFLHQLTEVGCERRPADEDHPLHRRGGETLL